MKLLLYCTKAKPYLFKNPTNIRNQFIKDYWCANKLDEKPFDEDILNGKIVAECDFEVDTIAMQKGAEDRIYGNNGFMGYGIIKNNKSFSWYDKNKACLSEEELFEYLEGFKKPYLIPLNYKCKNGYAIYIKNLHIFDEPRELNNYMRRTRKVVSDIICDSCTDFGFDCKKCPDSYEYYNLGKAPQNMMYVFDNYGNSFILISIKPEWLCKILNGEKTIEVKKKVLKEMLRWN